MKRCFKCEAEKPESEFYRHSRMADKLLGKCKECTKADVSANYSAKRLQYQAYERLRGQDPERKRKKSAYAKRLRTKHPLKKIAWATVTNAIRDGRLTRKPCHVCGDPKSQAHHDDYSKPLDVLWLCFKHHRERHGQKVA